MADNVTNTLTANINTTEDSTGNVSINRGLGNLAFDSIFGEFVTYEKLAAGDNVISLPGGKIFQLYVKNNDPALFLQVKFTPTALAEQLSSMLGPGEIFIIWQDITNPNANAGITSLKINASGANALVEYFLGG